MAKSEYDFVRIAVAQNPNITLEILASLISSKVESWNEQALAAALAGNLRTPVDVLVLLTTKLIPVLNHGRGNAQGFQAGVNLCCNPNTPLESLREILNPDKVATQFRKAVTKETRRKDVLNLLLNDQSETVRRRAQERMGKVNQVEFGKQ